MNIAIKPRVETVTKAMILANDDAILCHYPVTNSQPVWVKFTRIDGVIDPKSYKIEART